MSNGHAIRPPSGAAAWINCGAWVAMNATYPSCDTEESAEGVAAHEILQGVYENGPGKYRKGAVVASNGTFIDDEMIHGAEMFVDLVRSFNGTPTFEYTLPPGRFGTTVWGTPDMFLWSSPYALHVADYKYGHGFVDAFECWQLIVYVALILDLYQIDGVRDREITVHMYIVQPRNFEGRGPIRSWSIKASELRAYFNRVENAVSLPTTEARTGEHCRHCPGRVGCAAFRRAVGYASDVVMEAEPLNLPMTIAGPELRRLTKYRAMIDARIKGLQDEILQACARGDYSHGFDTERKKGRAKWNCGPEQAIAVCKAWGADIAQPVQAKSPRQATLAGVPNEIVSALSSSGLGELELIPAENSQARKIFGRNTTEQ